MVNSIRIVERNVLQLTAQGQLDALLDKYCSFTFQREHQLVCYAYIGQNSSITSENSYTFIENKSGSGVIHWMFIAEDRDP